MGSGLGHHLWSTKCCAGLLWTSLAFCDSLICPIETSSVNHEKIPFTFCHAKPSSKADVFHCFSTFPKTAVTLIRFKKSCFFDSEFDNGIAMSWLTQNLLTGFARRKRTQLFHDTCVVRQWPVAPQGWVWLVKIWYFGLVTLRYAC